MPPSSRRAPNLFLVGFPRCGTTSLAAYMAQHPEIVFCDPKEPFFFAPDIAHPKAITDEEAYLSLFDGTGEARYRGDGSTLYIYSSEAPRLIKDFSPEARIVISVRDPLDLIEAQHRFEYLRGREPARELKTALALEEKRKAGAALPWGNPIPEGLLYRERARCSRYIETYLETFGPEAVHLIRFDDLKKRPEEVLAGVFRFLELEPLEHMDLAVHNSAGQYNARRNALLFRLMVYRPAWLQGLLRRVPEDTRRRAFSLLDSVNRSGGERGKAVGWDRESYDLALQEFSEEIERLEALLGDQAGSSAVADRALAGADGQGRHSG